MRHFISSAIIGLAVASPAAAQEAAPAPVEAPVAATAAAPQPSPLLVLKRDTPVELLAPSEVRSDNAPSGTKFKLRINKPVIVGGVTVIPVGALAYGSVTNAEGSGSVGKSGRLTAKLLYVEVGDQQIALEGDSSAKGTGAGSTALSVVFVGVMGLFHRGNNAKIKAGEIMTGFIGEDVTFDTSSTPPRRVVPAAATAQ